MVKIFQVQELSKIVKNFQQQIFKKFQQQIFKNFQQQIFKNFQQQNFQKFSTAEFWTQNTVEFCYQQRWQSEAKNFQQQNFEEVTKLWQVTNLTCKLNCATCKLWQRHNFDFISATKKISTFVLKGASYIAFWKFSMSQDGENFPSQQFSKMFNSKFSKIFNSKFSTNFNSKFSKNFQQQNFEHKTLNTEHCGEWILLPAKVAKINSIPKWKTIYRWGKWKFSKYKNLTKSWSWWDVPKSSYFVKR